MFGKSGRESGNSSTGKRGGLSILGADIVITGDVRAGSDLHIEGRIEGDLDCGNLIQGAQSHIKGEVRADSARIAGMIEGSVSIRQLVVESDARIIGDIEYDTVSIEVGAHVEGRLKQVSAQATPTPALAAPHKMTVVDVTHEAAE